MSGEYYPKDHIWCGCPECGECECSRCVEDLFLRDMISNSPSFFDTSIQEEGPTIMSLQDTVSLIEKKYGKDWRKYPHCKCVVIWASSNFILEHVKEVVPDLYELCKEYHEKRTVNGKEFDSNFAMLAFYVIDPETQILL